MLLPVLVFAPVPVIGQASGPDARADQTDGNSRLCLSQISELSLPDDFELIGLTASEEVGSDPTITVWSRSELLIAKLLPDSVAGIISRMPLGDVAPLAATLVAWDADSPIVELFDPRSGAIWTISAASGETTQAPAPTGSAAASGAIRDESGWVWAQKLIDPDTETSQVLISAGRQERTTAESNPPAGPSEPLRGIDLLLHLRSDGNDGYLLQEAGFPFGTIGFTQDGREAWRSYPPLDELREVVAETDLRYVIATPAVAFDGAVLTTFMAVRSRHRVSSLRFRHADAPRYRRIPDDLAFLAVLPQHELLIGTRSKASQELILLGWRWTDQRQSCT
ncbi:MAG: hypothetical protein OXI39_00415 [Gemmatimonadota bacterium]|uniref:hypothetical protein n=1 Tax=Candidatus Palauibacter scopulicola TaxID=3056741 RepID=UPI00239C9F7E|nr:hypothetical protein [Candidatus Palauibacter scopulicola]MDE2661455.1 hypothetical protein [Candidatus Palauibacter scopulicola]